MQRYGNSLKHMPQNSCLVVEDEAPTKQLKTMSDDIIFQDRNDDGYKCQRLTHGDCDRGRVNTSAFSSLWKLS